MIPLIFKTIYQHPLLTEADLQTISEAHEKIIFNKGEIILREGKPANEYYVLQEGLSRAYVYNYSGDEITTEFFSPGEIVISPSSLFQRTLSPETIVTVTDAVMWKITFDAFQKLFHSMPGFSEWGRLWFTNRLFFIKQRSLDMITETATNRYLKLMKETPEIIQQVPLKQIASYLGITDTSLSRIRKDISA